MDIKPKPAEKRKPCNNSNCKYYKASFWTDPEGFSVVDLLALMFSISFISLLVYGVFQPQVHIKDYLTLLNNPISIILGGYFTNQGIQQWNIRKTNNQYMQQPSQTYTPTPETSYENSNNV